MFIFAPIIDTKARAVNKLAEKGNDKKLVEKIVDLFEFCEGKVKKPEHVSALMKKKNFSEFARHIDNDDWDCIDEKIAAGLISRLERLLDQ